MLDEILRPPPTPKNGPKNPTKSAEEQRIKAANEALLEAAKAPPSMSPEMERLYDLEQRAFEVHDHKTLIRCRKAAERIDRECWPAPPDMEAVSRLRSKMVELENREMNSGLTQSLPTQEQHEPGRGGKIQANAIRGSSRNRANTDTIKRVDVCRRLRGFFEELDVQASMRRLGMEVAALPPVITPPEEDEVEEGAAELDDWQDWWHTRCVSENDQKCASATLYGDYSAWCQERRVMRVDRRQFGRWLRSEALCWRKTDGNGRRIWCGIGLKPGGTDTA